MHVSRLRVIPKGSRTGEWCLILDLSFPSHLSVSTQCNTPQLTMHAQQLIFWNCDQVHCLPKWMWPIPFRLSSTSRQLSFAWKAWGKKCLPCPGAPFGADVLEWVLLQHQGNKTTGQSWMQCFGLTWLGGSLPFHHGMHRECDGYPQFKMGPNRNLKVIEL